MIANRLANFAVGAIVVVEDEANVIGQRVVFRIQLSRLSYAPREAGILTTPPPRRNAR